MMFRLISLTAIWLLLSPLVLAQEAKVADADKVADVRVLIDISGSMKKNDPNNLRVPALKLITQLMPNGTQSGVWTFGQWVNMLVPRGKVDDAWKEKAYGSATGINSKGQFTNIEKVLQDSTWDWSKPDDKTDRSLIFLTDGVVDISKDPAVNKEARKRILDQALTRFKSAGITIHTIALSDEADKSFLRQLSAATGGAYEQADSAAELERIFLKMFEKSVPVESVPMTESGILVDDSIKELTLLVFRKEGGRKTTVIMPDGSSFDFRKKPENVIWRHEERYDLITVEAPMPGSWKVDTDLDPDNRVMVVTDLNVRASRLPNLLMSGDRMPYYVELHEKNSVITKPQFLDFVTIMLNRRAKDVEPKRIVLTDDGRKPDRKPGDGRFSAVIGDGLTVGHYQYELVVNGTTFKRSKRYTIQVVDSPVAVNVTEVSPGDPAHYALTITPYEELVKGQSLLVDATVTKEGGNSAALAIPRSGPSEWRLDMDIKAGDKYYVDLTVQAERVNGTMVTREVGRFTMGEGSMDDYQSPQEAPAPAAAPPVEEEQPNGEPAVEEPQDEAVDETTDDEEAATDEEHEGDATEGEEESPNWAMVAVKVLILNGLLFAGGFFAYRKWFRTPPDDELGEEESKGGDEEK